MPVNLCIFRCLGTSTMHDPLSLSQQPLVTLESWQNSGLESRNELTFLFPLLTVCQSQGGPNKLPGAYLPNGTCINIFQRE